MDFSLKRSLEEPVATDNARKANKKRFETFFELVLLKYCYQYSQLVNVNSRINIIDKRTRLVLSLLFDLEWTWRKGQKMKSVNQTFLHLQQSHHLEMAFLQKVWLVMLNQ